LTRNTNVLRIPYYNTEKFGKKSLTVNIPQTWNNFLRKNRDIAFSKSLESLKQNAKREFLNTYDLNN